MPGYFTYKYTCSVDLVLWLKCEACGHVFTATWTCKASDTAERGATRKSVAAMARRKACEKRAEVEAGKHEARCTACGFIPLWLAARIRHRVAKSPGFFDVLLGRNIAATENRTYPNQNWSKGKELASRVVFLPVWRMSCDGNWPLPDSDEWPSETTAIATADSDNKAETALTDAPVGDVSDTATETPLK